MKQALTNGLVTTIVGTLSVIVIAALSGSSEYYTQEQSLVFTELAFYVSVVLGIGVGIKTLIS